LRSVSIFNPHFPLGLNTVILENAATYALVGLIIEAIRRHQRTPGQTDSYGKIIQFLSA